jgi:hypothetical protein
MFIYVEFKSLARLGDVKKEVYALYLNGHFLASRSIRHGFNSSMSCIFFPPFFLLFLYLPI